MAFQTRADLQNQAIGWLRKGYSSLGGGDGGTICTNLDGIWAMSVWMLFYELEWITDTNGAKF